MKGGFIDATLKMSTIVTFHKHLSALPVMMMTLTKK